MGYPALFEYYRTITLSIATRITSEDTYREYLISGYAWEEAQAEHTSVIPVNFFIARL